MHTGTLRSRLGPIAATFATLAGLPAAAAEFHSEEHGYTIRLPNRWVQVPADVLATVEKFIFKPGAKSKIHYDACFQEGGSFGWMTYPYVLLQFVPYSDFGWSGEPEESTFPSLIQTISGLDLAKVIKNEMSDPAREMLADTPNVTVRLDAPNRRYFWTLAMNVGPVGKIRGEVVGYFGRHGVVQVMFYDKASQFAGTRAARERIWESFKFDEGHGYDPAVAVASRPAWLALPFAENALILGIIAGGAACLFCLFKAFRRERWSH